MLDDNQQSVEDIDLNVPIKLMQEPEAEDNESL